MRIAIMGSGGVGGYFGARLAAGADVSFVARGAHLAAMRADGLRIRSAAGDLRLQSVQATDDTSAIGPVDLVLFAVKLWDTESAAAACRPLLGAHTAVIPFQNGVEAVGMLTRQLGTAAVMGGVAHIASNIAEPGVIAHTGTLARLTFGELDGRRSPRAEALLAACQRAGFEARISDDIHGEIWRKFVFLVGISGLTAMTRKSAGELRADPDIRPVLRRAMEETRLVAAARGVALPADYVEQTLQFIDGLVPAMKSSMLNDLENGRRLEAPWLCGAVARMAAECGIDAPVNATIYAALKPYVGGRDG
jgi:2-dehydropantoate 2-reductase